MPEAATPPSTWAIFEEHRPEGRPWGTTWLLSAPWAHPLWSQYVLMLYDLVTPTDKAPVLHLEGATHEFLLYALDPQHPVVHDRPPSQQRIRYLTPANLGYQFRTESNDAARRRVQAMVDLVCTGRLSPDTDYRSAWDSMMSDGMTLLRGVTAVTLSRKEEGRHQ